LILTALFWKSRFFLQPYAPPERPNNMNEEKELISAVLAGNIEALGVLYAQHSSKVLNLAWRISRDRELAEDILQEIFTSMPQLLQSFRGTSSFSTWVYRITHNRTLDRVRQIRNHSRIRENMIPLPGQLKEDEEDFADTLHYLLKHLEPPERALIWLKEAEGLSIQELSELLETPVGTLKSKLSRIRSFLRDILNEEESHV